MAEQLPVKFEFWANQTFDGFYPGSNQEILAQLRKTVTGTGEQFIFLWGNAGHGKSHLLHACCHEASNQGFSSFYLDLSDSVSTKPELFTGLEDLEIVCVDNIDALAGREDWESAFFNFFNQHRDNNQRLILSASCASSTLAFTLLDLQTRINWGLSLKIQSLDDNDKIAVLTYKARQKGFEIPPQVAGFLLTHYDRNLSSLWLMLDKLDWASLAAKRKLTIPFLKQILEQRN
ncbi:DnaA regulatory inactivator Hda [Methyloglobulus sp.]|uniref:DnaA regulatory inactivator Hda n=1 Tax=Methyloglobulus sp. TaxID=2518622 RepID=UPI003989FD0C